MDIVDSYQGDVELEVEGAEMGEGPDMTKAVASPDNMRPPPRPTTIIEDDTSETISHKQAVGEMDEFCFALGIWCQQNHISKHQYISLVEVLSLLNDVGTIKKLPKDFFTLKKNTAAQLPLLPIQRQKVSLAPEKLPTMAPLEKRTGLTSSLPTTWAYWFDPRALFSSILSSPKIVQKMHFGLAHFVDEPYEFWHSVSWASSVRSTSGKYAKYPDGMPIFPSDFIEYTCCTQLCTCNSSPHLGRVFCVGRDYTFKASVQGEIKLQVQVAIGVSGVKGFNVTDRQAPLSPNETILIEDSYDWILESNVIRRILDITIDYTFATGIPDHIVQPVSRKRIRRIANRRTKDIRPICLSHPPRAELEIAAYSREYFVENAEKMLSVPFLCFIDGFGLYRNMYRSLVGVYLTLASMNLEDRCRRKNTFLLTFGPHASSFNQVITAIKALPHLDKGMELMVRGEPKLVCAYTLAFTGDMPQQQENAGFKRQSANRGCRNSLIEAKERANLSYNTILNGRYHPHVKQLREYSVKLSKSNYKHMCSIWGFAEVESALLQQTPALDVIMSRPADAAHSEFAGIAKQLQLLLVEAILSPHGQRLYAAELRRFPFPPGWARLQSPVHHLQSWRMQESGRAAIITPMLLRCWLRDSHIRESFIRAAKHVLLKGMVKQ
jgi:hypothetical protein